jgi:hypothetical protein
MKSDLIAAAAGSAVLLSACVADLLNIPLKQWTRGNDRGCHGWESK